MAENILHFGGFRIRANGSGNLIPRFIGFDDVESYNCAPVAMTTVPGRQPLRLANFTGQRARLQLKTVNIDEVMKVNRLVIYTKPLFSTYPG